MLSGNAAKTGRKDAHPSSGARQVMKPPRYSDLHKYPHGYASSAATDIRRTFARVRAQQKAERAAAERKVTQIKKART